ncbi:hypothetical protein BD410DRAFT_783089 [Rickenella mellea]|uniref:Uncharacterized protein n=1 Tax=Rickenella mellea TaxID=50990 RepID=A0A4Y7QHR7_9AGAM|nr:hypothetical protein BD410DRAFT_783089 [Rickenella mellea]
MFSKSMLVSFATLAFALSASAVPAPAANACPAQKTVTVTAAPAQSTAGGSKAAGANGAKFGKCSTPQIKFAVGLDGRKEAAFQATDLKSFNHGSADNIGVITGFICQQVSSACGGNAAAKTECTKAQAAASAATAGGAQADAFNKVFGATTNFAAAGGAAAGSGAAAGGKNNNNGKGNNGKGGDPQKSLTLDPKVISTGFEKNGQEVPEAGQVPSLTSSNNFINFCLTQKGKPLTNGQQVKTGSCNTAPMGVIASTSNMPSSKFQFPKNFGHVNANTPFTIKMAIKHIQTGNFVNAQSNYYAAPQQVNGAGDIIGHSHFVIEQLDALDQIKPLNPGTFAFFKGVNTPAVNGVLSVPVPGGLPDGLFKLSSINAAMNHQPVLVAVAQHGSLDDCVYFTVGNGKAKGKIVAPPPPAANATTPAAPAKTTAAKGGKGGKGGKGN